MATLRNKTTDSGVIVRWQPHPDHNRPSTYQVTSSAVSFLDEIGYSVPNPGDETEIPWDVCRPLRVLGDLHFKSETPGEVETGDIGDVDNTYARSLSNEQQERLRSYIEGHPQYQSTSQSLTGELSVLPENEGENDGNDETSDTENGSDGTDNRPSPLKITGKDIIVGKVNRISSAGNALLETDGQGEYNLGPLIEDSVGNPVPVLVQKGTWAFCLDSQFWTSNYVQKFSNLASGSVSELVKKLFPDGTETQLQKDLDGFGVERDDVIKASITHSSEEVLLGLYRNQVVKIHTEKPVPKGELYTRVRGRQGPILVVEPTVNPSIELAVGEPIETVISRVEEPGGYGLYENTIVHIPGNDISTATRVRAGVSGIETDQITVSVDALHESERPTVGEEVTIENGTLDDYPSVPVKTADILSNVSAQLRLEVQSISNDHVVAGVTRELLPDVTIGDTMEANQIEWFDDGTLFEHDSVPIHVDGFHADYGKTRQLQLTDDSGPCLSAEVSDEMHLSGTGTLSDFIAAMEEGHRELESGDLETAAESFAQAAKHAPDEENGAWVDAQSCQAYATIISLMQREQFAGSQGAIEEAREELTTTNEEAQPAVRLCLDELEVAEHIVAATKAWVQKEVEDTSVIHRKVRAEAKQEIRRAADKGSALSEGNDSAELNRDSLHSLLIHAINDVADELDGIHNDVTEFLNQTVDQSQPIVWRSLTKIDSDDAEGRHTLVDPFDPTGDVPQELCQYRDQAEAAATPGQDAINFRDMEREYTQTGAIQQYIHARANGACEGCGNPAPFHDTDGNPYLELHHVDEFEMQGPDTPDRIVALCPTCHTRVHAGADGSQFNAELRAKLEDGLGQLGAT